MTIDLADDEEIRDISGYKGLYAITSKGRIYSYSKPQSGKCNNNMVNPMRKPKWLSSYLKRGKPTVGIRTDNKKKAFLVCDLVMKAFIGSKKNKHIIYLDDDRENVLLENMEYKNGLEKIKKKPRKDLSENNRLKRKLSDLQVEAIWRMKNSYSVYRIAKFHNVDRGVISNIFGGVTYREFFIKDT